MFDQLSQRLLRTLKNLRGQGRLSEDNIAATLREIRIALLEADVALPVVRDFIERVRGRAIGREVMSSLTPGQALIGIVRDELVAVLGSADAALRLDGQRPAVVLLAGLQGSGKTTTAAKLARWIRERQRRSVLLASCDVYRPAAIEQLSRLAADLHLDCLPVSPGQDPLAIAGHALAQARRGYDALIVDSAGRLHVDDGMMQEIKALQKILAPIETLFVADSMMGQDALQAARAFGAALDLTGIILTKIDGDARGGAALSIRQVTGRPIKFIGIGEKPDDLAPFHPDRIAARILGMGDVLSLIEEVELKTDQDKARRLAGKLRKGKGFDLEDFRDQLREMRKLGGLGALLDKLPGFAQLPAPALQELDERKFVRIEAIIDSMTPQERHRPELVDGSRRRRIAAGSGTSVQEVSRLLKQFGRMQKALKRLAGRGLTVGLAGTPGPRWPRG